MTKSAWDLEEEDEVQETTPQKDLVLSGEDWDKMPVAERVLLVKTLGLAGITASKSWTDLTSAEAAIISGKKEPFPDLPSPTRAHVALVDSDKYDWGIAEYTEGNFEWAEPDREKVVVGNWSRSPADGLIHVFLETPIAALQDKAIQALMDYAEKRRAKETPSAKKPRTRAPKPEKVQEPDAHDENLAKIASLRQKLGR